MRGRHAWKDIKRAGKCPYCGHLARSHTYVKGLSDLIDADIWTCKRCSVDDKVCTARGVIDSGGLKKKRSKETFGRKL